MDKRCIDLFNALRAGDSCSVKGVLETDDASLFRDGEGRTPLMILMDNRSVSPGLLDYIISKTSDVNAIDKNGDTALFYAVKNKKSITVEEDWQLIMPVHDPLYESVETLLEAGMDARVKNRNGETVLFYARIEGHRKCAGLIASHLGIEISEKASEGYMLCDAVLKMKRSRPFAGDLQANYENVVSKCGGGDKLSDSDAASILFWGELISSLDCNGKWNFSCERFYTDSMGGREVYWRIETSGLAAEHRVSMGLNESWQSIDVDTLIFDVKGLPALLKLTWDGETSSEYSPMKVKFSGLDEYLMGKIAETARGIYGEVEFECSRYRSAPQGFFGYEGREFSSLKRFRDTGRDLYDALNSNSKRRVSSLLKKGVGPELYDDNGDPYIMLPVLSDKTGIIELFIKMGAFVDARGSYGYTPLIKAICYSKTGPALFLIENGADINARDKDGYTPLMLALNEKNDAVIRLLLARGADLTAEDNKGGTVLICACRAGRMDVVKNCIESGVNVNRWSSLGYSPLTEAIYCGFPDIARYLIESGAEVDHPYTNRSKPLLLAASKNNTEILTLLLERGADIEGYTDNGMRALHFAAYNGSTETVRILVESGAYLKFADRDGKIPLDYAIEKGHKKIIKILTES